MKKIIIHNKYYGKIEIPKTNNAYRFFVVLMQAFANKEEINIGLMYAPKKMKSFEIYQKGGFSYELLELEMYIEIAKLLNFSSEDAQKLKAQIEFLNDNAQVTLSISKNMVLYAKNKPNTTDKKYLFWDIENFSNIAPVFYELIEPLEIEDTAIFISCNPDSLYLFRAEWEADLYDFGKTFNSFHFTKCDHGKNVADGVLLQNFIDLKAKNADIYLLTYDRELKERFKNVADVSTNLYLLERKILK
ncbi:MAG TPA: hypothetical protein CFH84_01430 [Sulfurimonas sp. UBA12504]|nr:MAG: hypothetical protein A2019_03820 [Sulfurimonas sp. GWF2_37_8]DAB30916.1 MAG TPA: hypothetical protein CFH84_01430 [Sulfurimonas sp. UBA12504]